MRAELVNDVGREQRLAPEPFDPQMVVAPGRRSPFDEADERVAHLGDHVACPPVLKAVGASEIARRGDAYNNFERAYMLAAKNGLSGAVDALAQYAPEVLASDEPDFEDGLIRICAEHESATTIITRDIEAFTSSAIPAMPAAEFLSNAGFDYEVIDW